jgi:hypothetical protein
VINKFLKRSYCFDISQIFCFLKQFCCKGMSEGMSTVVLHIADF